VPLYAARWFASQHNINYYPVKNVEIAKAGFVNPALQSIQQENPGVELRFLSASRDCQDANNDSLVLLLVYRAAKFLFTGDAEAEDSFKPENKCGGAEIPYLLDHFKNDGLLDIDVYKVGHHGSHNGTTDALIKAMSPKISVISAGKPVQDLPCQFHAFQFGHPRETTVQSLEKESKRDRVIPPAKPIKVTTMDKQEIRRKRALTKAIYCTCWDGNIIVEPIQDGKEFKVLTGQ
jgi:competence protein ComEC